MTLLAPFAGLLAGGLGLLTLLALHALRLRRTPVRISSTLLWKDSPKDTEVNTPWRRPRATASLMLQLLTLLLLALAIARPSLGPGSDRGGLVVIVLDATASMNAADASGTTALDRAKRLARERVRAMRRDGSPIEFAVVRAALTPTIVLAPTASATDAMGAAGAVGPTDQPGDPGALRSLLEALRTPPGEGESSGEPTRIVLLTDGGSFGDESLRGLPIETVTIATATPNIGIAACSAARTPDDPRRVRVFVRLVSTHDRPVGVVLRAGAGEGAARSPVEIPGATGSAPGSATRTVEIDAPGAALVPVAIEPDTSRADAMSCDDDAWIELSDPSPPRTVVYAPDARADPFLLDVLGVLAPGLVSVHEPTDLDAARDAGLIVYDRVTPTALPTVPSLGFFSAVPGAPGEVRNGRERIVSWDRSGPVLRDVSLGGIVFDRAIGLPGAGTPGLAVLAESEGGPAMVELVARGVRHLRVSFPLERSNWAVEVGMPIFVAGAFERLAPGTRGEGIARTTREPATLRATGAAPSADGPASAEPRALDDGTVVMSPPERVGVYRLTGCEPDSIGVSLLDAGESATPGTPGVPTDATAVAAPEAALGSTGSWSSARRELWPDALLMALLVMTVEFVLHAARVRV